MIHTDKRFASAVEQAVVELERDTDAEVIVVAASRSGGYRDVAMTGAFVVTVVLMVLLELVPFHVDPWLLVVDVVVAFPLLTWLLDAPWFVRRVTPGRRLLAQVRHSAESEFHREHVHATPNRTGLLVYVSALEGRVELIADVGLRGRIPDGAWAEVAATFSHDDLGHFLAGLAGAGRLLAEHVPALDEDPIDLPNAPRVRG